MSSRAGRQPVGKRSGRLPANAVRVNLIGRMLRDDPERTLLV